MTAVFTMGSLVLNKRGDEKSWFRLFRVSMLCEHERECCRCVRGTHKGLIEALPRQWNTKADVISFPRRSRWESYWRGAQIKPRTSEVIPARPGVGIRSPEHI
jgi:hypothetical protein